MARFILRYRGAGSHSEIDLARLLARRNARVVDQTSRMVLVEGSAAALEDEFGDDPDWLVTPERSVQRPDPRPKVRSRR